MHGAGLVNSYFLREGSSFVEIFPCRTGAEHVFASFREPQRIEGGVFGLSLFVRNESLCTQYKPEEYEQDSDGAGLPRTWQIKKFLRLLSMYPVVQ
jgi:hypothetical protein